MTIRKRNDETGYRRGEGHYSDSKAAGLQQKTFVMKKASAEGTIMSNGDRKAGFAAKLDKK